MCIRDRPYTLDRTLRWIQRQVDPTLKMLETITAKTGIDYLKEIRKSTKLTEKHYKIIEQQTLSLIHIYPFTDPAERTSYLCVCLHDHRFLPCRLPVSESAVFK